MSSNVFIDIENVCLICLKSKKTMHNIVDYDKSKNKNGTSVKSMLETCTKYKLKALNCLPNRICDLCRQELKKVYSFQLKYTESYKKLKAFLNGNKVIIFDTTSDRNTQTEESTFYPCERCDEKYYDYESLKSHRDINHKDTDISCRFCQRTFTQIGYLKNHIAIIHPESGYISHNQCSICKRQFTRQDHMRRHLALIHKILESCSDEGDTCETDQQLSLCDRNSLHSNDLKPKDIKVDISETKDNNFVKTNNSPDHEMSEVKTLDSSSEDEDDKTLSQLINKTKTMSKSFMQVLIEESFLPDKANLESEFILDETIKEENPFISNENEASQEKIEPVKRKRGRPPKLLTSAISKESPSSCSSSLAINSITNQGSILEEQSLHNLTNSFQCSLCSLMFPSDEGLNHHLQSKHNHRKLYKCLDCNKDFKSRSNLLTHMDHSHNSASFTCNKCPKTFKSNIYLQRHMDRHKTKRFVCKECSEKYETKEELTNHMKLKGHDKPLLCPECGLRCKTTNILLVHLRRHKGEKPFKCKFCGKGFPRIDDLKIHEKYHTGEKSHFCETCGKGFQRKYNLKIHLRVHTGEKPYKCPHCPQAFTQGNDLKAHIRRHTGERFRCELCGDAFLQAYQIRHHKLQEHGIKEEPPTQRVAKFTSREEQEQQIKQIKEKQLKITKSVENPEDLLKSYPLNGNLNATDERTLKESEAMPKQNNSMTPVLHEKTPISNIDDTVQKILNEGS